MDRPQWVTNEGEWLNDCQEVVRVSQGILERSIGLTEGVRSLFQLQFALRGETDSDFLMITGICSDTDSFPLGEHRSRWASAALARVDREREAIEARRRPQVEAACHRLIQKYQVSAAGCRNAD